MKFLLSTRKANPQAMEKLATEIGFDGLEVVLPSHIAENKVDDDWSLEGVTIIKAIHAANGIFKTEKYKTVLEDSISIAKRLNVSIVNIHPPSGHADFGGRQNVIEGIKLIKKLAAENSGIKICYEALSAPVKDRHHLQQAYPGPKQWLEDIKKYDLYATLDTTHIASWDEDPVMYIELLGSHLTHIHVSDYIKETKKQHCFPGEGDIKWSQFLAAVQTLKQGEIYITFEPSGKFDLTAPKEHQRLENSLNFAQQLLAYDKHNKRI